MLLLSFTACFSLEPAKDKSQVKENNQVIGNKDVEIPSPFIQYKTLVDAEKFANLNFKLPSQLPDGYNQKLIEAVENKMIQLSMNLKLVTW